MCGFRRRAIWVEARVDVQWSLEYLKNNKKAKVVEGSKEENWIEIQFKSWQEEKGKNTKYK